MATEVAYYTYIYAKVERDKYQQVTGFTKAAVLSARFLAGVVAQLLVSFHLMDLRQLNYISLGCEWSVLYANILSQLYNDNNKLLLLFFICTHNVAQIISLAWALLLPSVSGSMYFHVAAAAHLHRDSNEQIKLAYSVNRTDHNICTQDGIDWLKFRRAWRLLWNHFTISYSNPVVIQWSFWWALAMCGFMQVNLWELYAIRVCV